MLDVEVLLTTSLRFDDGSPVRAASAIAPFGGGWLVAQDDATHAAWWRDDGIVRLRLFPPVDGLDLFAEDDDTKRLKPDLEAAFAVEVDGRSAVLLLGSGSLADRTRSALVVDAPDGPEVQVADLTGVYDRVARAMGVADERRNLEGACLVDGRVRWFQRGDRRRGVPDASVDLEVAALLAAAAGDLDPAQVPVGEVRRYDLGVVGGAGGQAAVPLGITDAVALADGRVLVAAAAEDTDDPVADGPVSASALVVLEDEEVVAWGSVPPDGRGHARKVEGLAILGDGTDEPVRADRREAAGGVQVLAVVDADEPTLASPVLELAVELATRDAVP